MSDRPKHPGGRPRKSPEERLSEYVRFRLTTREADLLYRAAVRQGQTVTEFMRAQLRDFFDVEIGL